MQKLSTSWQSYSRLRWRSISSRISSVTSALRHLKNTLPAIKVLDILGDKPCNRNRIFTFLFANSSSNNSFSSSVYPSLSQSVVKLLWRLWIRHYKHDSQQRYCFRLNYGYLSYLEFFFLLANCETRSLSSPPMSRWEGLSLLLTDNPNIYLNTISPCTVQRILYTVTSA